MADHAVPAQTLSAPPMEIADAEMAESERIVDNTAGSVHSWDLVTGADGPGTRMTLFMAGCGMRCQFCHNPDTWRMKDGKRHTVEEVLERLTRYQKVMDITGGGLTISGGEPLLQSKFVTHVFHHAHKMGIHTALDTAGLLGSRLTDEDLEDIDLVLLDIKSGLPETYQRVTGRPLQPTLDFGERLSRLGKKMWVRFVLVPELTDAEDNVDAIGKFVATLDGVERMEILPFHQHGKFKWEATGEPYLLADAKPPTDELIARVKAQLESYGLPVTVA